MRRFREGRRRSGEAREQRPSRRRRAAGVVRSTPQRDVPADQPACLVCEDGVKLGSINEVGE